MTISFTITENMHGYHHFVDSEYVSVINRPFHFKINWGAPIISAINPKSHYFMQYKALGKLFVGGLTSEYVSCRGSLVIDYFKTHKIIYNLKFEAKNETFNYVGKKTSVKLSNPLELIKTHTTCYGKITNTNNKIISYSVAHFKKEELLPFIRSFKII